MIRSVASHEPTSREAPVPGPGLAPSGLDPAREPWVSKAAEPPVPGHPPAVVYLYFGSKWGKSLGRQRLLPQALARHTTVVFLEGTRSFSLRQAMRRPRGEWVADRVLVVRNAFATRVSPLSRFSPGLACRLDAFALERELSRHGIHDYVFWLSSADPLFLRGMSRRPIVYDCIDPSLSRDEAVVRRFHAAESEVARGASHVFATAQSLAEKMARINPACSLLPNACEGALGRGAGPRPEPLRDRPGPVVGCMGTLDGRIDLDRVFHAARALPEATFVMVGRVNADRREAAARLDALPNVAMVGQVPFDECERYNVHFDVAMIPIVGGRIGDATNPVKLWNYLAAGHPVVATATREMRRYEPMVQTADDAEAFVAHLRSALAGRVAVGVAERQAFAAANTWDHRAETALAAIARIGAPRTPGVRR